jgi:hypothetical protein
VTPQPVVIMPKASVKQTKMAKVQKKIPKKKERRHEVVKKYLSEDEEDKEENNTKKTEEEKLIYINWKKLKVRSVAHVLGKN